VALQHRDGPLGRRDDDAPARRSLGLISQPINGTAVMPRVWRARAADEFEAACLYALKMCLACDVSAPDLWPVQVAGE